MPNVKITYAYGSEGTFQRETTAVLSNKTLLSLEEIRGRFEQKMINKNYFVVEKFKLPSLKPVACDALSNDDWHELISIEETEEIPTEKLDVTEIL